MLEIAPSAVASRPVPSGITRAWRRGGDAPTRVIFLNRFFFPDHSSTSQILSDLAFYLAGCGIEVRVITSQQLYDDPSAELPATELVDGVRIDRVATTRFGRSALLGRGFDYLSFYRAVGRRVVASARPGDILVAKTDPPLLCLPAMQAARRQGLHLINWLQDIYPEVAIRLGLPLLRGPLGRGLVALRDAALHAADANVAIGEAMAEFLRERRIVAERIQIIPNWCDDEDIQPVAHPENPLRGQWGLTQRFVIGYSGNLGRAHEFDTVLGAAEHLRDNREITFLFIGGGNKFEELAGKIKQAGVGHLFRFLPYQDRSVLKYSLGAADVHWVSLKPELEGLIVPSKFYGIAAAGRPTIAVTAKQGEIARLVHQHQCGIIIEPGDTRGFAEALLRLAAAPDRVSEMGTQARAMLDRNFGRQQTFRRWRDLLENIALTTPTMRSGADVVR